jgi:Cof subfamily protein (haloacid dehalogenase superfamily)
VYVTDLDGTLLNSEARLSDRTRAGLISLLRRGLVLTVASARSVVSMQPILRGIELPLPVVESNGAFVSDLVTGRHLLTNALDAGVAAELYALIFDAGCLPFLSAFDGSRDRLYYSEVRNPGMDWYVRDRTSSGDTRLTRIPDLTQILSQQMICLTAIERPEVIMDLSSAVKERYGDSLTVRGFANEYFSGWDWMTVHDGRARKDKALAWLLRECGLEESEVVAIGDSDSDVPMLRYAARGIAVANATSDVLEVAGETVGSNSDDGVIGFLERDWSGGAPH